MLFQYVQIYVFHNKNNVLQHTPVLSPSLLVNSSLYIFGIFPKDFP